MNLDCTCFRIRQVSRRITQLYDAALRPVGLRVTQYSLLSALRNEGPMSVAELAKGIGADTTSLSRAVATVSRKGWVVVREGPDKRSKSVAISKAGLNLLDQAEPHWQRAQEKIAVSLGADGKRNLDAQLAELSARIPEI